ncbi:MAG TPA: SDR family oxidoreductase [Fimbriimonadaceae bacterium]|nr:SDR family oxidoreductase [Fimbriimonadaceae bacterium]
MHAQPRRWLVTGAAGFIGSNLVEALLRLGQQVVGMDNFATGYRKNLEDIRGQVSADEWARFCFLEADIRSIKDCEAACDGVDFILHQAALGSVPRSIEDPYTSNAANVDGHLNMMLAARSAGIKRFVYASSSAVYGDHPELPKVEHEVGKPLSPYAITKAVNELYAANFADLYGLEPVGLRYFNVFGRRQDPNGAYAAVIPKWIAAMISGETVYINGTGETSRDFCYIENVVQANILAATAPRAVAGEVFNIAVGARTTLNELFEQIRSRLAARYPKLETLKPTYRDFRTGDVLHSLADTSKAREMLGYQPTHSIGEGLDEALEWYCQTLG